MNLLNMPDLNPFEKVPQSVGYDFVGTATRLS